MRTILGRHAERFLPAAPAGLPARIAGRCAPTARSGPATRCLLNPHLHQWGWHYAPVSDALLGPGGPWQLIVRRRRRQQQPAGTAPTAGDRHPHGLASWPARM